MCSLNKYYPIRHSAVITRVFEVEHDDDVDAFYVNRAKCESRTKKKEEWKEKKSKLIR